MPVTATAPPWPRPAPRRSRRPSRCGSRGAPVLSGAPPRSSEGPAPASSAGASADGASAAAASAAEISSAEYTRVAPADRRSVRQPTAPARPPPQRGGDSSAEYTRVAPDRSSLGASPCMSADGATEAAPARPRSRRPSTRVSPPLRTSRPAAADSSLRSSSDGASAAVVSSPGSWPTSSPDSSAGSSPDPSAPVAAASHPPNAAVSSVEPGPRSRRAALRGPSTPGRSGAADRRPRPRCTRGPSRAASRRRTAGRRPLRGPRPACSTTGGRRRCGRRGRQHGELWAPTCWNTTIGEKRSARARAGS